MERCGKVVCFPSNADGQITIPDKYHDKIFPLLKTYYKGYGNDRNRPYILEYEELQ